ncbi:MAG: tRNA (adenosine(37)-N6)-dimethylallyltransferase MiaA [Hyphomicrobiales bacterium]|nr:tRNA (adenosine(37)-N6)-dimethylallyltransferase MiaA [Hyphomicrobiales bacterium]
MSAILIAGPTTSGKSALALKLAQALDGTVINADSMQVYRDLRIITARPTAEEEARIPHALYGHVDAADSYSVGRWCNDARRAIETARSGGRLPLLVGGTGLYFKAITRGLAAVPPIADAIRALVRERLASSGAAALHEELARRDPASASRLMPGDRSRIARALEVYLATGRSLSDWHREGLPPALGSDVLKVYLDVERTELYRRIDVRFDEMIAAGALEEVRALAQRRLDPALPAMKAHGVPWLIRHLAGDIDLAAAAQGAKRDTRRYTKRQATWFRNQLPDFVWMRPQAAEAMVLGSFARARSSAADQS